MFKRYTLVPGILTAGLMAFGLSACGDDSSSNSGTVTLSCKVTKESPLTIKSSGGGYSTTTTFELVDGKVLETVEYSNPALAEDDCEEYRNDRDYGDVDCKGSKIVATGKEKMTDDDFEEFKDGAVAACKASDGQKVKIDDDDDGSDGTDNQGGKTTTSGCDFKQGDDVWEYSYSTDKDASGASTTGTMRYEFDGKKYTTVSTTITKGGVTSMMCSSKEILESMNMEEKTGYGTYKLETTCKDGTMTSKGTNVVNDYEKNNYSREDLYTQAQNQCKNPNGFSPSTNYGGGNGGGSGINNGYYEDPTASYKAPVCNFKENSDTWEYEVDDPGIILGNPTKGTVVYKFDGGFYTKTATVKMSGEWVQEICADEEELGYRNSEFGDPESNFYSKTEATCEGGELIEVRTVRENYIGNEYSKKDIYEQALASCQAGSY